MKKAPNDIYEWDGGMRRPRSLRWYGRLGRILFIAAFAFVATILLLHMCSPASAQGIDIRGNIFGMQFNIRIEEPRRSQYRQRSDYPPPPSMFDFAVKQRPPVRVPGMPAIPPDQYVPDQVVPESFPPPPSEPRPVVPDKPAKEVSKPHPYQQR